MRKIVKRGLYTYMEGMCPGNEEGIAQNSRTAPAFYEELGYRLKFTAWQRIISHRNQRRAALLPETHNSGSI